MGNRSSLYGKFFCCQEKNTCHLRKGSVMNHSRCLGELATPSGENFKKVNNSFRIY
ncbi:protein of unknown function [Pseudodesulfovibrio profundus]|uniref:Uncharacterized protein n=1 Tax=Pseudodesulfovibrio profundus TaxID=57320 RepID=A0A2C8FAW1_9BACT|nr:protein of unknown function [Pseudodesulfovibrio profundus]